MSLWLARWLIRLLGVALCHHRHHHRSVITLPCLPPQGWIMSYWMRKDVRWTEAGGLSHGESCHAGGELRDVT